MFAFTTQRKIISGSHPYPRFASRRTATSINRRKSLKKSAWKRIAWTRGTEWAFRLKGDNQTNNRDTKILL